MFAVMLVLFALPAWASSPREIDNGTPAMPGGGGHLPVGGGVTKAEAIHAAYELPAVQATVTYMLSRGYVQHATYDDAALIMNPPATFVALSFEKPGLLPTDWNVLGAPMILIGTVVDWYGVRRTTVTGGLAFVDTTTGKMWTADSLPAQYPDDQSFEVVSSGGGDDYPDGFERGRPRRFRSIGRFDFHFGGTNSTEDQKFRSFMSCSYIGAAGALVRAGMTPPPIPQKIVIQAAVSTAISVVGCAIAMYGGGMP